MHSMEDSIRYKEYLQTIFNTRLLFNTRRELAEYIGMPSLASNSVEKIKSPFQRKAIYSELAKEYDELTDGQTSLDGIMEAYQRTSLFYFGHLERNLKRHNNDTFLFNFIDQCYVGGVDEDYLDAAMLLLYAIHVLPTYNARSKDIGNFRLLATRLKDFLKRYVSRNPLLSDMPMISMMFGEMDKEEKHEGISCNNRAYLINIAHVVLERYHAFKNPQAMQVLAARMYESGPQTDIEGYWTERDGTVFWKVESVAQNNSFFLYQWQFDAGSRTASYTRYSMQLMDDNSVCMLVAPWAVAKIAAQDIHNDDKPITAWYKFDIDEERRHFSITSMFRSNEFPPALSLSKVTDKNTIGIFDNVIKEYSVSDNYAEYHFDFYLTAEAITDEVIFVGFPHGTFRIPFDRNPEFAGASMQDNIGYMTIGDKLYIVYDDRNIYIDATDLKRLEKELGITVIE